MLCCDVLCGALVLRCAVLVLSFVAFVCDVMWYDVFCVVLWCVVVCYVALHCVVVVLCCVVLCGVSLRLVVCSIVVRCGV